ncbi:SH3 domain-containing RING finger protein 3-like, partial [Limulus polyphemus]|uniref:SH3 domain-containing RING finger protein 3-like n=1 Tax=Limulus polyphemus TaxID=6850 RepID=A0ABM1C1A1_LIMPO
MDETFLNDILECSVCLEQLDTSSKVLPCQHTFCRRCLEEIVNSHKELRCPECRVLVETKVEDLPCNILLIRLLEGIKNNSRFTRNSSTGNGRRLEVSCGSSSNQTIPHSPHVMTPRQLRYQPGSGDGQLFPKQ